MIFAYKCHCRNYSKLKQIWLSYSTGGKIYAEQLNVIIVRFFAVPNWILMPQKLTTGRRNHVAMMVSDEIGKCSLP